MTFFKRMDVVMRDPLNQAAASLVCVFFYFAVGATFAAQMRAVEFSVTWWLLLAGWPAVAAVGIAFVVACMAIVVGVLRAV